MYEQPCAAGMESLMRHTYESANVPLEQVRYMECHATGTQVGRCGPPYFVPAAGVVETADCAYTGSMGLTDEPYLSRCSVGLSLRGLADFLILVSGDLIELMGVARVFRASHDYFTSPLRVASVKGNIG
jgi:hypothetical protein